MTDPEDKPSFLARLSIVATVGIIILQIGLGVAVGLDAKRGLDVDTEDWLLVVLFPAVSFFAVACLYYLFKGKPTYADKAIADDVCSCWKLSLVFGAIYSLII